MQAGWNWRQLGALALAVCLAQMLYWLVIERQIFSNHYAAMPELVEFQNTRIARLDGVDPAAIAKARYASAELPFTHCCDTAIFAVQLDFVLPDVPARGLGILSTLQTDNYQLFANGSLIVGEGSMTPGGQDFFGQKTFLERIPAGVLREGVNTLQYITVRDGFPYTDIMPPLVGEHDALQQFAGQRLWVMNEYVAYNGLLMALVGLFGALLLMRSDDKLFALWLSVLAGGWALYALYTLWLDIPVGGSARMMIYFIINLAIPASLLCFVDSWTRHPIRQGQMAVVGAYLLTIAGIAALVFAAPMPDGYDNAALVWSWFLAGCAILTVARFAWHFLQHGEDRFAEAAILSVIVIALPLEAAGQLYPDLRLGEGYLQDASAFFMVAMIAAFLSRNFRLFQSQSALNGLLRTTVKAREAELADAYDRERALVKRQAHDDERKRIMRDLHDGMGGQLMAMMLSARLGDAAPDQVATQLQSVIDEMRLMVDSMDSVGESLGEALETFRARIQPRVEQAGFRFAWDADNGLILPGYGPRGVLQVFRILQEAVTNALRHSGGDWLGIAVRDSGSGRVEITVRDNGRTASGEGAAGLTQSGRGLGNMQSRAHALGGTCNITRDTAGGVCMALNLPVLSAWDHNEAEIGKVLMHG